MNLKKFAALTAATTGLVIASTGAAMAENSDAWATGAAEGSPGIVSGNNIDVPINIPINLCGNEVNVIAVPILNFLSGINCQN
jgi:hypothetical protein